MKISRGITKKRCRPRIQSTLVWGWSWIPASVQYKISQWSRVISSSARKAKK